MVKVALSGLALDYPHSGSAVYTRNLVPCLLDAAPDIDFTLFLRQTGDCGLAPSRRLSTGLGRLNHGSGFGARLDKVAWEVVSLPVAGALEKASLLHVLYWAAPVVASAPFVVTVHDVIPLVVPGYHRSAASRVYTALMSQTVKRAAAIVTVSQHAKQDIVRAIGFPEDDVHVIYEAADARFRPDPLESVIDEVLAKYKLPPRFLLYLGGAERRKNIETLVRAWSRVADHMRDRETRLVIVARFPPPDRLYPDTRTLVGELALDEDVVLISSVDESDKPSVYRAALAFCFPSTHEGFGLPPLEAMASGTPVIASNASSLPEVVGNAAVALDPLDVAAWSEAMLKIVDSPEERRVLGERGIARAAQFSWRRAAEETVAVYQRVLEG